jgi:hypothetical protein
MLSKSSVASKRPERPRIPRSTKMRRIEPIGDVTRAANLS